jgi:hypothetical protein
MTDRHGLLGEAALQSRQFTQGGAMQWPMLAEMAVVRFLFIFVRFSLKPRKTCTKSVSTADIYRFLW